MVPSPMLIDLDQDNKLDVSLKAPLNQDDGSLRCTNNCEDTNFDMDTLLYQQTTVPDTNENSEVEVVEFTNTSDIRLPEGDDPDATEYSSSFADSVSLSDDNSRLSDAEVESEFCGDNGPGCDGYGSFISMRKKKLTDQWRSYIRPLMWRCKWVELMMKEFRSQASKYNAELAECLRVKQLELGQYASEGCGRTLPFCRQIYKRKVMKRRKRKKVEDTTDIPSYMASHNLFSHYEKKSDADGASADEDGGNPVMADVNGSDEPDGHYELSSFECKDGDNSTEQILWKIEIAQSKAKMLKTVVDKLLMEHAGKFSSMENLSIFASSDLPSSSARSPTFSPGHGDAMPIGALYTPPGHTSEFEIGNLVIPESAVSSYMEETPLPNVIENPVGLLSAAENPLDQPQAGASSINMMDDILIGNHRAAGKVLNELEKVSDTAPVKVKEEIEEERNIIATVSSDLVPKPEILVEENKIVPKEEIDMKLSLCAEVNVPKNKRKRGERKPGSGAWNNETISTQRSSGEPDYS
ncbi:hypothetical protein MKX01_037809 [Papaver californicum]|nr:hypothetical protein MKX01_037809 [Papaver californicum]